MPVTPLISPASRPDVPSQPPLSRVWLAILALLVCYQAYHCLTVQKSLGWDSSMGFLTLQSSLEHGDYNRIHHPVVSDLTKDTMVFVAWWTPGQYLIPYWVSRALALDIGFALRLVALFCSVAGLAGCYLLYTKLGFNRRCVCLSLIVICSQHYFLKNSSMYSGGDLLLFAAAPFAVLGVFGGLASFASRALVVAVACFVALFLKASALTLFLALTLYLAFEIHGWPSAHRLANGGWKPAIRQLLTLGGIMAVYVVAAYLIYLSKEETISASARPWDTSSFERLWGIPVALAGPVYGAFSFLESYNTKTLFIPMGFLGLFAVYKLGCRDQGANLTAYRRLFVASYVAFVVFFSYAYIRGMSISYESRHFRVLGLLLLPGLIQVLLRSRHQAMLSAAIVMLSLFSLVLYHWEFNGRHSEDSLSRWDVRQPVSNASLEAMHRLDDTLVTADTIVFNGFGACPALLLEFNRGRKLQDDNWLYYGWTYSGRATTPMPWYRNAVESIVLIVPKNTHWYFGPTLQEIAMTFERPLHVVPYFENSELILYVGRVY
jgi:hypothetical protein